VVPFLVQAGPITVGTHDAFSILAVLVGLGIYYRELRKRGWLDATIVTISAAVVVGGALGARLITAWEHPQYYSQAIAAGASLSWLIEHSGKSILGAIAGGYLAGVLAKRSLGYTRSTGDYYVVALAVATAVGRIGCFLSELPLGTPTDLPWGIAVNPATAATFARCPSCTVPMHPSMLYEIAFNLAAVVVILRWRRLVPVQGELLKLYLLAAFTFRFLVEFVRGNQIEAWGLTGPQIVLIPLSALLVLHFARQIRREAYHVPVAPRPAMGVQIPRAAPLIGEPG